VITLLRDTRFTLRSLFKRPGFSLILILTLAIGIGANTAMFSVVHGALLRPLPYSESDELVAIWSRFLPESGFDFESFPVAPPEFFDYRDAAATLEDVAAYFSFGATITGGGGEPERLRAVAASANLFGLLGVDAAIGRTFVAEEDASQGPSVAVLGHSLWQRRYGGDPDIVGRTIVLNGRSAEIVGVMPPRFAFPGSEIAVYVPLAIDPAVDTNRRAHYLAVLGRLADGVTVQRAEAEMRTLMEGWQRDFPDIHTGHFLIMRPLLDQMVGDARPALLVLLAAVAFVLLVVCANVANLLLVRGEGRRREMALRVALGAGRHRILQQLLTEGALIAAIGGGLGLLVAAFGVDLILSLQAGVIPRADRIGLAGEVFIFAAAITFLTAVIFGLVPALHARSSNLGAALRESDRTGTARASRLAFRRSLVITQVAVSLVLVVAAALLIASFARLQRVDPGFRPEGVLVAQVSLPLGDYPEAEQVVAFYTMLRQHLEALPGVISASAISSLPLQGTPGNNDFEIEDLPPPPPGSPAHSGYRIFALPGLARAMGIEVIEGRFFEETDRADALPVVVVNRALARTFWPGASAIGKRIRLGVQPWLTIVGVVDDVKFAGLDAESRPAWYVPQYQAPTSIGFAPRTMTLTLRTAGDPVDLAASLRRTLWDLDPNLPIVGLRALEDVVAGSIARPRFTMTLMILFAGVAIFLGAVGIYGVVGYVVARRTHEIGIRMALGAEPRRVAARVLGEGVLLAGVGVAIGIVVAMVGTRLLSALLFGVSPTDAAAFISAAGLLVGVALIAAWVPARRATRVDPAIALREE